MALIDVAALAADTTFRSKITAGIARKAAEIGSLVLQMDSPTAIDKQRLILARQVLQDSATWTDSFAWVLAADSSISGASTDDSILFYIGDYWNLLAGVSP